MVEGQRKFSLTTLACPAMLAVFFFLLVSYGQASDGVELPFPAKLAKILYQQNPDSEQQIYIVAQSHRSAITGINGSDTERVQAEIYRIGEWLIENRGVAVLLPEGYFRDQAIPSSTASFNRQKNINDRGSTPSDTALLGRLLSTDHHVNANMLLHADFDVALRQIEDRDLYTSVCRLLRELTDETVADHDLPDLAAALSYQQKKRSAVLLGNIPAVLSEGIEREKFCSKNALFTVGLTHIKEIIQYLLNGQARINPVPGVSDTFSGYYCDLNALKNNYGITILLPRTLADNKDLISLVTL
jgi:hypothetical protein